jgi:tRNA G46 methylase TrmB
MQASIRPFNAQAVPAPRSDLNREDVATFLARSSPLDLEIGCGVGWHSIRYAKTHSARRLIAVEHTGNKFASFQSRLQGHEPIENLLAVHADVVAWVTHHLVPGALDRVFILYPNPEPKAENKRWFRMPFMAKLLETLKPGGEITLATNIEAYFTEALRSAESDWNLELVSQHQLRFDASPRTHFEKKYLERGQVCWDGVWRKPNH